MPWTRPSARRPHLASVKVREGFVEPRERLDEIDAEGHAQIVPAPLEAVVLGRSDANGEVAGLTVHHRLALLEE